jgi:predicted nucleic acid-binding protein
LRSYHVVPLDAQLALDAAEYSLVHRLPMADAIAYATAQALGAVLVTGDVHFQGLPGVEYIAASDA